MLKCCDVIPPPCSLPLHFSLSLVCFKFNRWQAFSMVTNMNLLNVPRHAPATFFTWVMISMATWALNVAGTTISLSFFVAFISVLLLLAVAMLAQHSHPTPFPIIPSHIINIVHTVMPRNPFPSINQATVHFSSSVPFLFCGKTTLLQKNSVLLNRLASLCVREKELVFRIRYRTAGLLFSPVDISDKTAFRKVKDFFWKHTGCWTKMKAEKWGAVTD